MRWLLPAICAGASVLAPGPECAAVELRPAQPAAWPAPAGAAPPRQDPAGDLERARAAYERDRTDIRAALQYAGALVRSSSPELARPVLYGLLTRPADLTAPQAAEAWFQMGHVHLRAQETDEALACWNAVLREHLTSDRASGAAVNVAALLLESRDDTAGALDVLTARLRDGTIRGPHLALANVLLFQVYVERRDYRNARGLLGVLPTDGERYDRIRELVPIVYWKTGDESMGRELLVTLHERAHENAVDLNLLAATMADHGVALDLALAWIEDANRIVAGRRHDVWDTYAEVLFRLGRVAQAIDAEDRAISLATAPHDRAEYRASRARYQAALAK
jgi:tetratricopeptide (TPR) repeat protein